MLYVKAGVINWAELFYYIFIWLSSSVILSSPLSFVSCPHALLMSHESQYVTKQMLAGGKSTKSIGRPCVGKWSTPRMLLCVQRNVPFKGTLQKWKVGFHSHLYMDRIGSLASSTVSFLLICLHPLLHNVPCIKHRFGEPECEQLEVENGVCGKLGGKAW